MSEEFRQEKIIYDDIAKYSGIENYVAKNVKAFVRNTNISVVDYDESVLNEWIYGYCTGNGWNEANFQDLDLEIQKSISSTRFVFYHFFCK